MIKLTVEELSKTLDSVLTLVNFWKSCKYGIPVNGKITNVTTPEYFQDNWKLLTPEQFSELKGGICYDYVEYGASYLESLNIPYKKFYVYMDTPNSDTHTFIIVPYKDRFIYVEGAFKSLAEQIDGFKTFDTEKDIFNFVTHNMSLVYGENLEEFDYWIFEYTGHPEYGCDAAVYTQYCTSSKLVYEKST